MGITYIRNAVICKVFRELGYVEKLGSGFITLFEEYEKRRLHSPQVIEGENFIKCILPRPSFSSQFNQKDTETKKILALFEISNEIAISSIMKDLNTSRATTGRYLAQLVKQGYIQKIGKGKATRYRKARNND